MQKFVEIAQTTAEIWLFFDFQDGGRRHHEFVKFQIFNGRDGQEVRNNYRRAVRLCGYSSVAYH